MNWPDDSAYVSAGILSAVLGLIVGALFARRSPRDTRIGSAVVEPAWYSPTPATHWIPGHGHSPRPIRVTLLSDDADAKQVPFEARTWPELGAQIAKWCDGQRPVPPRDPMCLRHGYTLRQRDRGTL